MQTPCSNIKCHKAVNGPIRPLKSGRIRFCSRFEQSQSKITTSVSDKLGSERGYNLDFIIRKKYWSVEYSGSITDLKIHLIIHHGKSLDTNILSNFIFISKTYRKWSHLQKENEHLSARNIKSCISVTALGFNSLVFSFFVMFSGSHHVFKFLSCFSLPLRFTQVTCFLFTAALHHWSLPHSI